MVKVSVTIFMGEIKKIPIIVGQDLIFSPFLPNLLIKIKNTQKQK